MTQFVEPQKEVQIVRMMGLPFIISGQLEVTRRWLTQLDQPRKCRNLCIKFKAVLLNMQAKLFKYMTTILRVILVCLSDFPRCQIYKMDQVVLGGLVEL